MTDLITCQQLNHVRFHRASPLYYIPEAAFKLKTFHLYWMILTQVVINCSICCTSTNFTLWRRLQSTQHRLLQHNVRVFVEVEHKKDALFTFTLNVTFFAVVAVHSNCAQASNESRLSPLHRPVTGQSQASHSHTQASHRPLGNPQLITCTADDITGTGDFICHAWKPQAMLATGMHGLIDTWRISQLQLQLQSFTLQQIVLRGIM